MTSKERKDINEIMSKGKATTKKLLELHGSFDLGTYQRDLNEVEEKLKKLSSDIEKIKKIKPEEMTKKIKDQLAALEMLRDNYKLDEKFLIRKLGGKRYTTQEAVITNIKSKTKEKKVKLGDIETESGNAVGYIARLKHSESIALPNTEFMIVASLLLDESIESLLLINNDKMSQAEKKINQFIQRLILDTENKVINWQSNTDNGLIGIEWFRRKIERANRNNNDTEDQDVLIEKRTSDFLDENYEVMLDDAIEAEFGENNFVCILPIMYSRKGKTGDETIVYEVYLGNQRLDPLCITTNIAKPLKKGIEKLYNIATNTLHSLNINEETELIIDNYLEGGEKYGDD